MKGKLLPVGWNEMFDGPMWTSKRIKAVNAIRFDLDSLCNSTIGKPPLVMILICPLSEYSSCGAKVKPFALPR